MKRKIALIASLLLLVTMIFAGCNQTQPTNKAARWDSEETYSFNITLADYNAAADTPFNYYIDGTTRYYKDFLIQTSMANEVTATEEIRPQDVRGTYTVDLKRDGSYTTLTTSQVIYAQYKTDELQKCSIWNELQEKGYVTNEADVLFEKTDGLTTLVSTNDAYVKFASETQQPTESSTKSKGFYIGKTAQTVSAHEVSTTYDFDKKTATVKIDGNEQENKLNVSGKTSFIDINQVSLFARSFDKSSAFADSPTATVFNPLNGTSYTASFFVSMDQNAVIDNNGIAEKVKLNVVSIALGNNAFMSQLTLPKLKDLDTIPSKADAEENIHKYTTVRFRVGFLAYEVNNFYTEDLINALKPKTDK